MSTVIIVCGVTRKNRVPQKEKNYKSNVIYQRESEKKDIVTQLFVHVGVYKQII